MGFNLVLKDVRYVIDICLNLISIGKLDDDGYNNQFGEAKWKLSKDSLVLPKGKKVNILYVIETKIRKEDVNVVGHTSEKKVRNSC